MWDDMDNSYPYEEGPHGTLGPGEPDPLMFGRQVPHAVIWYTELNRMQSLAVQISTGRRPGPVTVFRASDVKIAVSDPSAAPERSRIVRAPGSRLMGWLRFLLSPGWYRLRIAPTIADMHEEYYQELKTGHTCHARWIAIRGHLLVVKVLAKGVVEALKDLIF
jgi:hypothetical protein